MKPIRTQHLNPPRFDYTPSMLPDRHKVTVPDFQDVSEINRKAAEKRFLWVHGGIDRMPVKGDTRGAFSVLLLMAIMVIVLGIILGS